MGLKTKCSEPIVYEIAGARSHRLKISVERLITCLLTPSSTWGSHLTEFQRVVLAQFFLEMGDRALITSTDGHAPLAGRFAIHLR